MRYQLPAPPGGARYASVDDVLGPRETRFFGDGFRRSRHELRRVAVSAGPGQAPEVTARAGVSYPADWSRKGSMDQAPHLSTIDVLVIAVELSDLLLERGLGLGPAQRRAAALEHVTIAASRTPVEHELAEFAAAGRIERTVPDGPAGLARTRTACLVGNLRAECEISHVSAGTGMAAARPPGAPGYGAWARRRRQFVEDVTADFGAYTATATVRTEPGGGDAGGLDSARQRAASPVDCFAAALQLGQLLLYELDAVPRSRSDTLWMRHTTMDLDPGRPDLARAARIDVALEQRRLLETSKGESWRTADITGQLAGIRVCCSVAHRIRTGGQPAGDLPPHRERADR